MTAVTDVALSTPPTPAADEGRWTARRRRVAFSPSSLRPLTPLTGTAALLVVLMVWGVAFVTVLSGIQEARLQRNLYADFRRSLAVETAPLGGGAPIGTAVALLTVPQAGIHNSVIVEGTSSDTLRSGPGHLRSTVLPGQVGVSVIYGKSLTAGAPFRRVASLRRGADITVTTQQGVATYVVDRIRHVGSPGPPAYVSGGRLVLVTSEGIGWQSGWAPEQPVYVDATLKGTARMGKGGQLAAVPTDEQAMRSDTEALILVVLGLQALLLVLVGVIWVRSRWSRVQTWAVAVPTVLAAMWFTSEHALGLLPNLV